VTAEVKAETKERKKRTRRNYQSDLEMLRLYCEAQVNVLGFVRKNLVVSAPLDGIDGQISAYTDVLARLNGGGK
jgi:hypothetical protein